MREDRLEHIKQALIEVELIKKDEIPSKTAREFIDELRKEVNGSCRIVFDGDWYYVASVKLK